MLSGCLLLRVSQIISSFSNDRNRRNFFVHTRTDARTRLSFGWVTMAPFDENIPTPSPPVIVKEATTATFEPLTQAWPSRNRTSLPRSARDVWDDLRSVKWTRVGGVAGSVLALVWILNLMFGFPTNSDSVCKPDGSFSLIAGYDLMTPSSFFKITLAFGSFTFTEAKIIDIAWDIVRSFRIGLL